jgi:hypothetical protein
MGLMEDFTAGNTDGVVEVVVPPTSMDRHGGPPDKAFDARDNGEFICLVDSDILADPPSPTCSQQRLSSQKTSGTCSWG